MIDASGKTLGTTFRSQEMQKASPNKAFHRRPPHDAAGCSRHTAKKYSTRYHDYPSARRLRSAGNDPAGIRLPAVDLERIVVTAISDRLKDGDQMERWLNRQVPAGELPALLKRCMELAAHLWPTAG